MNENDGHKMLVARMVALEEILLNYIRYSNPDIGYPIPKEKAKEIMEEKLYKKLGW